MSDEDQRLSRSVAVIFTIDDRIQTAGDPDSMNGKEILDAIKSGGRCVIVTLREYFSLINKWIYEE